MCYNGEEYELVTHIDPCTCADIDYECDLGYQRSDEMGGQCVEIETDLTQEEKAAETLANQNKMCQEYGYYEITRGYRKIPGNICTGGIDLAPYRYQCSSSGRFLQLFSFRNILIIAAISAICYYGWPMIEAILLMLPIPDPSDAQEKINQFSNQAMSMVKGNSNKDKQLGEYRSNFDAPKGSDDEDEDDNDDEEDIGRSANTKKKDLDYDSDEKQDLNDEDDGAKHELINLDDTKDSKSKKKVPKLRKPT